MSLHFSAAVSVAALTVCPMLFNAFHFTGLFS
jgi:hypothetical protein